MPLEAHWLMKDACGGDNCHRGTSHGTALHSLSWHLLSNTTVPIPVPTAMVVTRTQPQHECGLVPAAGLLVGTTK